MENRLRLLTEVVDAIIESGSFTANRIGFRISPNGVFGGMGSKDNYEMFTYVAKTMNTRGLAYRKCSTINNLSFFTEHHPIYALTLL